MRALDPKPKMRKISQTDECKNLARSKSDPNAKAWFWMFWVKEPKNSSWWTAWTPPLASSVLLGLAAAVLLLFASPSIGTVPVGDETEEGSAVPEISTDRVTFEPFRVAEEMRLLVRSQTRDEMVKALKPDSLVWRGALDGYEVANEIREEMILEFPSQFAAEGTRVLDEYQQAGRLKPDSPADPSRPALAQSNSAGAAERVGNGTADGPDDVVLALSPNLIEMIGVRDGE